MCLWYIDTLNFTVVSANTFYAVLKRDTITIHLQWHAGTKNDPLNGGAVLKIFVEDIGVYASELLQKGSVSKETIHYNTPWNTHEFGIFDPNKNVIFFVQEVSHL